MSASNIIEKKLEDIKKHNTQEARSLKYYVELRLNKSVESYYKDLLGKKNFLECFSELSVAKKLNKNSSPKLN